jgi:hypothetical protein
MGYVCNSHGLGKNIEFHGEQRCKHDGRRSRVSCMSLPSMCGIHAWRWSSKRVTQWFRLTLRRIPLYSSYSTPHTFVLVLLYAPYLCTRLTLRGISVLHCVEYPSYSYAVYNTQICHSWGFVASHGIYVRMLPTSFLTATLLSSYSHEPKPACDLGLRPTAYALHGRVKPAGVSRANQLSFPSLWSPSAPDIHIEIFHENRAKLV